MCSVWCPLKCDMCCFLCFLYRPQAYNTFYTDKFFHRLQIKKAQEQSAPICISRESSFYFERRSSSSSPLLSLVAPTITPHAAAWTIIPSDRHTQSRQQNEITYVCTTRGQGLAKALVYGYDRTACERQKHKYVGVAPCYLLFARIQVTLLG